MLSPALSQQEEDLAKRLCEKRSAFMPQLNVNEQRAQSAVSVALKARSGGVSGGGLNLTLLQCLHAQRSHT